MERALSETARRRKIQMQYNEEHGIVPKTIMKDVRDVLEITKHDVKDQNGRRMTKAEKQKWIEEMKKEMRQASKMLEFEHAAWLRDKIRELQGED